MDPLQGDSVVHCGGGFCCCFTGGGFFVCFGFFNRTGMLPVVGVLNTVAKRSVQQGDVCGVLIAPSFSRWSCVELGVFHTNVFLLKRIKMQWLCWLTLSQPTHDNTKWCYRDDVFDWYDCILQSFQFFPFSFRTIQDCLTIFSIKTLVYSGNVHWKSEWYLTKK